MRDLTVKILFCDNYQRAKFHVKQMDKIAMSDFAQNGTLAPNFIIYYKDYPSVKLGIVSYKIFIVLIILLFHAFIIKSFIFEQIKKMRRIAVFCGSSIGHNSTYANEAKKLGLCMAQQKIGLVYGGGKIGMMGVIADTVMENKGEVIGVIPHLLRHEEVAHTKITKMMFTKKMSKRKVKISRLVDGYIAMAGGFGTLDELFEALTLGQLSIESKPIGILNTNGYFNHTLLQLDTMVKEGFLKQQNRDLLLVSDKVDVLIKLMNNYKAPKKTEVINKVVKANTTNK